MAIIRLQTPNLTYFYATGELGIEMIFDAVESFYLSPTELSLWNLRKASIYNLTNDDIYRIISYIADNIHKRPEGKSAIVAPKDVDYGVGRAITSIIAIHELRSLQVSVFRSIDDAVDWLELDKGKLPDFQIG